MFKKTLALGLSAMTLCACATTYSVTPVDTGSAKVTYDNGRSTTDLEQDNGAIKITPLGISENGRVNFSVAAYNKSGQPVNFGTENFAATIAGAPVKVFTHAQLERQAKNAATWAAVAVAVSGAAAVYAANQNAYSTTNSTLVTPRGGVYNYHATTYNPTAAAIGTTAATAATAGGLYTIKNELNSTLDRLGSTILQTTTIDPKTAYGGQIVLDKPKGTPPYMVEVKANWNGEDYTFRFSVAAEK